MKILLNRAFDKKAFVLNITILDEEKWKSWAHWGISKSNHHLRWRSVQVEVCTGGGPYRWRSVQSSKDRRQKHEAAQCSPQQLQSSVSSCCHLERKQYATILVFSGRCYCARSRTLRTGPSRGSPALMSSLWCLFLSGLRKLLSLRLLALLCIKVQVTDLLLGHYPPNMKHPKQTSGWWWRAFTENNINIIIYLQRHCQAIFTQQCTVYASAYRQ